MPTDSRKLYQQVAAAISASIDEGRYKAGMRLPTERDLAEEFKVSRPTIREAMIALEIRGLVEARRGSGIYVTRIPPSEVGSLELDIGAFELTEARILFEGEAAALAAATITNERLDELAAILKDMDQEDGADMRVEQADRRFHVAIAAATGNSAIRNVIENLWDMRYRSPLCMHMFGNARRVGVTPRVGEHREIFDALKAHDPQAARLAMRNHLGRVVEDLLRATEMEALERARSEIHARRNEIARRSSV